MRDDLEDIQFELEKTNYGDLAESLEHWAEMFYDGALDDEYAVNIAYLLYEMSKEMRRVNEASI